MDFPLWVNPFGTSRDRLSTLGNCYLTVNIEGSTFPNFTGGTQTRILSFDGDEVTYFNPTPSMGGSAKVTYRRAK